MNDIPAAEPPPLPAIISIPDDAIAKWGAIPINAEVLVPLTRTDLDLLFHSLRQASIAQMALGDAFQAFTHGRMENAQAEFRSHQETIRYSMSNVNIFITNVMQRARTSAPK